MQKLFNLIIRRPAFFFLFAAIFVYFILRYYSSKFTDFSSSDLLVEAHGMLFDLIVFGIILSIYEHYRGRVDRIERYNDEIDDFRGWDSKEAAHRIAGCIKRLNREGVTQMDLSYCYLSKIDLMQKTFEEGFRKSATLEEAYFWAANLKGPNLSWSDLQGVNLEEAILNIAVFNEVNLERANLQGAFLIGSDLSEANLKGANLKGANLEGADLKGANLERADLEGAIYTTNQLLLVKSLYKCKNLDPTIEAELREKKPCLFTAEGCD